MLLKERFREFMPVVLDLETGGVNPIRNAILQIAVVLLDWQSARLVPGESYSWEVTPFEGSLISETSIQMNHIDPNDESRNSQNEDECLRDCNRIIRKRLRAEECKRALLVGHNAHFDRSFYRCAMYRNKIKRDPFHLFTVLDTASLSALVYGHTVLSIACERAGIEYDIDLAHSAPYDAKVTAELFCMMVNEFPYEPTWPLESNFELNSS